MPLWSKRKLIFALGILSKTESLMQLIKEIRWATIQSNAPIVFYLNYLTSLIDYCLCLVNISDLRVKLPYSTYWQSDLIHNNPEVLINEPQPRQLIEVQNIPAQQNSSWQSGTHSKQEQVFLYTHMWACALSHFPDMIIFSLNHQENTSYLTPLCS